MESLALNYRDPPFGRNRTAVALLAAGGFCLAAVAGITYQLAGELSQVNARIEQARTMTRRSATPIKASATATSAQQLEIARANQVLARLNLPWLALFNAVETSQGDAISLLEIAPDAQQRTLKINAEAKNLSVVLDYLKRLDANDMLGPAFLQSHEVVAGDAQKPVRFSVVTAWRAAR